MKSEGSDDVIKNLDEYTIKMKAAIFLLTDTAAKLMAGWAQDNAKWTDRSSNARQGIKGKTYWENDNIIVITLSHSVDYGVWLELANQRKYAILADAIASKKDELMTNYKKILGA